MGEHSVYIKSELQLPVFSRHAFETRYKLLKESISLNDKILEVGSGNRLATKRLEKEGFDITDLDFFETYHPKIVCDARKMPFQNESFDKIFAFDVLEHCNCFDEIYRVLKKGGLFVCTVPDENSEKLLRILSKIGLVQKLFEEHDVFVDLEKLSNSKFKLLKRKNLFFGMTQFGIFKKIG